MASGAAGEGAGMAAAEPGPAREVAPAAVLSLENALGDDQEAERVTVYLDDLRVGEITVDRKTRRAALRLPLSKPAHRYRLEGEARFDGVRYRVDGGGLIVTTERMDEIAERANSAVDAVAAYQALVAELRAAAPEADLEAVTLVAGPKADDAAITAAEKRLKVALPEGYRRLVKEHGAFRLGSADFEAGAVLSPQQLATVLDFYLRTMRENGWEAAELDQLAARIGKRFRASKRDVVLDHFELGEPTVLIVDQRCPKGQIGVALPGSDFDLLGVEPGDNPFMGLIDYDYIMGEPECYAYDRLLAYSLHDHLLEMGDEALFVRNDETRILGFYRARTDDDAKRVWLRFTEVEEEDDED